MNDSPYSTPEVMDGDHGPGSRVATRIFGCLGLLIAGALLLALLLPFSRNVRPAARRMQCQNNLKQIGLALHHYHDDYGTFPPAYTTNAAGRSLHSWRTLILPYIEQQALFDSINLSKPWNDPANQNASEASIEVYCCPAADIPEQHTTYLGSAGPGSFFYQTESRQIKDITDGTYNTLMVIEVPEGRSVHWMSPEDADEQTLLGIKPESELSHIGGMNATLADGSVHFLSATMAEGTWRALISIDENDILGEY